VMLVNKLRVLSCPILDLQVFLRLLHNSFTQMYGVLLVSPLEEINTM
jgi:hypothetical protein